MKTKKISPFKKRGSNKRKSRKKWPQGSRSHQPQPPTLTDIDKAWEIEREDDL